MVTDMVEEALPAAAYGKATKGRDEYSILWTQPGFTDPAQLSLRKLARAYQFLGGNRGSDACYPDCFALWPLDSDGGWLAARLRDAGRDSLDRMHTLRIDAVFVPASVAAQDRSRLLGFLERGGWPNDTFEAHICVRGLPSAASTEVASSLAEFQPAQSTSAVLRAFHSQAKHSFDTVLDAKGLLVSGQSVAVDRREGMATANTRDDRVGTIPTTRKPETVAYEPLPSRNLLRTFMTIAVALLVGTSAGFFWQKTKSDPIVASLQEKLLRTEEQHQRELDVQQRAAKESYDSLLAQARQMKDSEESFRALAADFGFTNVSDLEAELKKRGLPKRSGDPNESRQQKIRRLWDSLGTELFSPATASPVLPSSNDNVR
jgi:hypothetical protein